METANTIADNAPLSIRCIKVSTVEVLKDPGDRNLARSTDAVAACFASSDYVEGRDAFLEKRKPNFKGA
jgi:1,4-dihydroxy-2-naphthoyl-CoA synthase